MKTLRAEPFRLFFPLGVLLAWMRRAIASDR